MRDAETDFLLRRPSHTPAQAAGVAVGNNRVNSSRAIPKSARGKETFQFNNICLAGQTLSFPCSGDQFYLPVTSGKLEVKPDGGSWIEYVSGTGLAPGLINTFYNIQVRNPSANPIVFSLIVGFAEFIDKRVYLPVDLTPDITYPTQPTPTATKINILDRSGSEIQDINGNAFYAISRRAIIVTNVSAGDTYLLQEYDSNVSNGPAIGAVGPGFPLNFPTTGDYTVNAGGGVIEAIVSEIYQALPKTI